MPRSKTPASSKNSKDKNRVTKSTPNKVSRDPSSKATIHEQNLLNGITSLLNNEAYSDLVIECGGRRFHALKGIVCSVSPVLARECNAGMRESVTGVIKHETFSADTMERMLSYIYCQTYHVEGEEAALQQQSTVPREAEQGRSSEAFSTNNSKILIAHADVFGIADYYEIHALADLAVQRFRAVAAKGLHIESFPEVIKAVNERAGDHSIDLQDALTDYAVRSLERLVDDEAFMEQLAYGDGAQEFTTDMLRRATYLYTEMKEDRDRSERTCRELQDGWRHLNATTDNLAAALKALPRRCPNAQCNLNVNGDFVVERRVNPLTRPKGWRVLCNNCGSLLSAADTA